MIEIESIKPGLPELFVMMRDYLVTLGFPYNYADFLNSTFVVFCVVIASWIAHQFSRRIVVKGLESLAAKTESIYDDFFVERKVFVRISYFIPGLIFYAFVQGIFNPEHVIYSLFNKGALTFFVVITMMALVAFFNAVEDAYQTLPFAKERPIKGYIQVFQLIFMLLGVLIIISILFNVHLTAVFAGLGATAAVLLLVFKDTIMGFTASIQLSANKMLQVGDWITMNSAAADGRVIEITLNTVKVQNWDMTITTIPTYNMVANSFQNWRGMEESGSRRIKKTVNIDVSSVKICSAGLLERMKRVNDLKGVIEEALHSRKSEDGDVLNNSNFITNLSLLRHYVEAYLRKNDRIIQDKTLMVRILQPTDVGIPLDIICFTTEQGGLNYEGLQGEMLDMIISIVSEFELRVFQRPSGHDYRGVEN